jgi:hypothetical protein
MLTSNYKCGQQELYAIARTGWNSCFANLPTFSGFKTKYTPAFISARLAEIDQAEDMPDEEQREELSRTLRVQLSNKATEVMGKWQTLKRYIIDGFPEDEREIKFDAAGQAHYRKAGQEDWSSVQRLVVDGNTFIQDNKEVLITNGSMPQTFTSDFATTKAEYSTLYQRYLDASVSNPVNTEAKITANNNVHAKLMNMLQDGQGLFRSSEAMKKMFTFDQVALTVGGPGAQGLKGNILQAGNQPVPGAELTFTGATVKTVTADENGRYDCPQLKEGGYIVTVTASGFQPATNTGVEVAGGVMKVLDFTLVKSE